MNKDKCKTKLIFQKKRVHMKTIIFLSSLFFISIFAQAQNQLSGKLLDAKTKSAVAFASAALYHQKDSSLVVGTVTDDAGLYQFNNLKKGKYYLKFSFLGYKPMIKSNIEISGDNAKIDLGTIELNDQEQSIGEVKIEAERLKGVEQVDRTVYAINQMAIKASNSGLDLLKKIPSVQVDMQNNISLEGSSNILIYVDGKKRDKEYVAQIDPSLIDKVEIITNPSSKYDADVTGVINILLKKDKNVGMSGRIDLEIPTSERMISSSSAGIDYGIGKFHFFGSGFSHYEQFGINEKILRESTNGNINSVFNQNGDGKLFVKIASIDYGFDYFINNKNTLNFYANYNPYQFNFNHDFDKTLENNKVLAEKNLTDSKNNDKNLGNNFSLFYKKQFDKQGQELTSEVSYYTYSGTQTNENTDQYLNIVDFTKQGSPIYRKDETNSNRKSVSGKMDYSQNFGSMKFETGLQVSHQWLNTGFKNFVDGVLSGNANNDFKYKELRSAAYVNLSGKLKELSWQIGSRFENSNIEVNDAEKNSYYCILPTLNLQHKLGEGKSIKFTYRRSITRPNASDLNPFVIVVDSMNSSKGNPKLEPYYTNKFQLTYNQNFGNNFIAPYIYADRYSNYFQQISTVGIGNKMTSYIDNVAKGFDYGAGLSAGFQPFKWWNINTYGKIFQIRVEKDNKADLYNIAEAQKVSWQAGLTSVMTFFKNMNIITYAQYNSPQLNAQTTSSRSFLYLVGLEKGMFSDRAKLGVYYYLPFINEFVYRKSETNGSNFHYTDTNTIDSKNIVSIKFAYNFNSGKEVKRLERNKTKEDEGKKMGF